MEEKKRLSGKEKRELECLIALYWMTGEQSHLRKRMEESGCWANYKE